MILNDFLKAIALKLKGIWADRGVFVDAIPRDIEGSFFVGIIESEQEKKLDRIRKRTIQFEVLYFLKADDNMDFNSWVDEMYEKFEVLEVRWSADATCLLSIKNTKASRDSSLNAYRFLFDIECSWVIATDAVSVMENLDIKTGGK